MKISKHEFVVVAAALVSLGAMSTDAILPMLQGIGTALGVAQENDIQLMVSAVFAGLTLGQLFYGPIADSWGRTRTIMIAVSIFCVGSLVCMLSQDLNTMLAGRLLQGAGAIGARVAITAMARDLYRGREMAQLMSFIMTVFVVVPMLSPAIGQTLGSLWGWRSIFAFCIFMGILWGGWAFFRMPETLKPEDKQPLSYAGIGHGMKTLWKEKISLLYTINIGLVLGTLLAYLNEAAQIYQDVFDVGENFIYYFSVSAIFAGIGSITNGVLVKRFGMRALSTTAIMIVGGAYTLMATLYGSGIVDMTVWHFVGGMSFVIFFNGMLMGNMNALAMDPMAHIAGLAAAVIGTLSTGVAVIVGTCIGMAYNGTPFPLLYSGVVLFILAFGVQMAARLLEEKQGIHCAEDLPH